MPRLKIVDINLKERKMGMFNFFMIKKELEFEIKRLKSIIDIDRKNLQAEYDILASKKTADLEAALRKQQVDLEDKLNKQATLYNESLQKLNLAHAQAISQLESKLAKEYFDKLTVTLREINLEGNVQAKFTQELSMKMLDKALDKPMPAHFISERLVSAKE